MTEWFAFWSVALVIYTVMAAPVGVKVLGDIGAPVKFLTEEHA